MVVFFVCAEVKSSINGKLKYLYNIKIIGFEHLK